MREAPAAIAEQKRALRQRMLAARRALPEEARIGFSGKIAAQVLAHEAVANARTVLAYAATADEVQTGALLSELFRRGKRVTVPWIAGKRTMEAALLPSMDALEYGAHHILTVLEARRVILPPEEIDIVLVPGVAFGMDGARLGMGGGYYDVFLPRAARATSIALAFQCQIAAGIPQDARDCSMDWLITETGVFDVRGKR